MRPRVTWLAVASLWLACSPPPRPPTAPPPLPASAPPAPPVAPIAARRAGRTLLAEGREGALEFVLLPVAGGRSALAVAERADSGVAWVRRLDGGAAPGPLLRFVDGHLFGGFDRSDGSTTYVTSDGTRLCFGVSAQPAERPCVQSAPSAVVPVGDRLALLELTALHVPEPAGHARGSPQTSGAKASHPLPKPRETQSSAHHAATRLSAKGAKTAKKKPAHAAASHRASHPLVELAVRWVDPSGAPAAEATPTGLHFEAPLDGMTLADARGRPPGIDLLWFETAPGRKAHGGLGSGRLMAASLRADGSLDFASRVAVFDADLEYGQLKDHRAPRLAGADAASIFLDLDGKAQCEALAVHPTRRVLTAPAAACAVAPDRLAGPLDAADLASFERILADDPRRAFGQPRTDPGLVAWAGDRAYYLHGTALRSAARAEATPRDEPPPFPTHRAPIPWGAFAPGGEGIALAGSALVHIDAHGLTRLAVPESTRPALADAEVPPDRRRAVRIEASWWIARGPRRRVWPDLAAPLASPAGPDTAVLVGGPERGLSLELASGALRVASLDASGAMESLGALVPAPVRVGFDACERAAGGALLAGVSATDPAAVVALTVDASGHAGAPHAVPLPWRAGQLGVRLVPLPSGGALLTDLERRHVVWLDDEARPLGDAAWPAAASDATCPQGRPMRLEVPGPAPGQLVAVPDVAAGACITGDALWSPDGSLHWFGGTTEGLDFLPESASLALLPALAAAPAPVPAAAPSPSPPAPPRLCPAEMVSIAGRFCVDRFEATLADARTGAPLSPDYPTTPNLLDFVLGEWSTARERTGNVHARAFPLPWIAPSRVGDKPEPVAVVRLGVRPSGYVTGVVAAAACTAAGKRLCSLDEFVTACRGEGDTLFPYGDTYEDGVCNVFREEHPAALLHGNASVGHLDPRLNRVLSHGHPLLRRTGESPACRSRWGDDAVYDMVGNIDEWVDEGNGAFAGGFYARSTRSGCEAVVTAHPRAYLDYSTGVRCCQDPR